MRAGNQVSHSTQAQFPRLPMRAWANHVPSGSDASLDVETSVPCSNLNAVIHVKYSAVALMRIPQLSTLQVFFSNLLESSAYFPFL